MGGVRRIAFAAVPADAATDTAPSLNERLGYSPEKRLVIVSCDDFGSCHAANVGVLQARLGRHDDGLAAVEEAIKLDPVNSEYRRARELILSAK